MVLQLKFPDNTGGKSGILRSGNRKDRYDGQKPLIVERWLWPRKSRDSRSVRLNQPAPRHWILLLCYYC